MRWNNVGTGRDSPTFGFFVIVERLSNFATSHFPGSISTFHCNQLGLSMSAKNQAKASDWDFTVCFWLLKFNLSTILRVLRGFWFGRRKEIQRQTKELGSRRFPYRRRLAIIIPQFLPHFLRKETRFENNIWLQRSVLEWISTGRIQHEVVELQKSVTKGDTFLNGF